jgi:hypothetical protein
MPLAKLAQSRRRLDRLTGCRREASLASAGHGLSAITSALDLKAAEMAQTKMRTVRHPTNPGRGRGATLAIVTGKAGGQPFCGS